MKIESLTNSRLYVILFYTLILLIYIFYYGVREQVDFTAFHRAAVLFVNGANPYDRNYPFYFLNAPSSLMFLAPLGFLGEAVASVLFRLLSTLFLVILYQQIKKDTHVDGLLIGSLLILSTPIRTTFGSGLAGLIVAISIWNLVRPLVFDRSTNPIVTALYSLGVLSFKPYLIIGVLVIYLVLKKYIQLLWIMGIFVIANLIVSLRQPLYRFWLDNLRFRSKGLTSEEGASSIVSSITRLAELIPGMTWIAFLSWPIYIGINSFILFAIFKSRESIHLVCLGMILSLTSALYINHRDYVILPLVLLLLLNSTQEFRNLNLIRYLLRCGLLLTSAIFQLVVSIFEPKTKINLKLLVPCVCLSLTAGFFWKLDLRVSFAIYDLAIQAVTYLILFEIFQIDNSKRKSSINP
jgi:hypothetical protein